MHYSFIVPVYNRPHEIQSLLACLTKQTFRNFEVLVVESGSSIKSDEVVKSFESALDIRYFYKANEGQGFSRNFGMERAKGDFFIILDSDVLLDTDYLKQVDEGIKTQKLDAFGGPDKLHPAATDKQKAVNYSMTSFLTTGGIRGSKKNMGKFYPRSFNMGISRKVYEVTGGYKLPFLGEDIELSARMMKFGFKTGLIEKAHVYHERKKDIGSYFKQMHWFGRARINIFRYFPHTLKIIHFVPVLFVLYLLIALISVFASTHLALILATPLFLFFTAILVDAYVQYKSIKVVLLSIPTFFIQLFGYAIGMLEESLTKSVENDT